MTMVIKMSANLIHIPAGEFKAKCLQLMDEIHKKHLSLIITKRGIPVAQLIPVESEKPIDIFGCMKGTVTINGDIINPIDVPWEANQDE